jgi:phosphoglycolate phosphatase-like HAD superfamily hydrolase
MIGVEHRLAHRTGLPKEKITQALGSHPHYEVGNILDHLLSGKISYEQYRAAFFLSTGISDGSVALFDEECLSMLATPYDYTEELLAAVAAKCDVFLLSDHCETWVRWITKNHQFMSIFKDIVWSFEIGATKRDQKPFEVIMSRNNLKPETCLFVDDLARNIGTAQRLGMKTVHFIGRESIKEIYSAIDIKTHAGPVNADSPRGSLKKPCVNKIGAGSGAGSVPRIVAFSHWRVLDEGAFRQRGCMTGK